MKVFLFNFFLISGYFGFSQNNSVSSGGNATGSGGTSSFSVGQVVYTEAKGPGGSLNQGVQQPFEITTSSGDELQYIQLLMVAYPNPTSGHLLLKIEDTNHPSFKDMRYQLTDVQGKILYMKNIIGTETNIPSENLASAMYLLHVYYQNTIIKSFKIIKN